MIGLIIHSLDAQNEMYFQRLIFFLFKLLLNLEGGTGTVESTEVPNF